MPFSFRDVSTLAARTAAMLALAVITAVAAPDASAQNDSLLVDNGSFSTTEAWNCTSFSIADDFTIAVPATVSTIRFWALGYSYSKTFDHFSGTMSWFIHSNSDINRPGSPVVSGFSSAIAVKDTGLTYSGNEIPIFQLDIPTNNLRLNTGTYWLRLKEGTPTDTSDTTSMLWAVRDKHTGQSMRFDPDPVSPTAWDSDGGAKDLSFQLLSPMITPLAEPVDAPEPGTFALLSMILLPSTCAYRLRLRRIKHQGSHS